MVKINSLKIGEFTDLIETYLYYDGPRLYSIKHSSGVIALVYWYREIENYIDQFLYTFMDDYELYQLENNAITLNEFFDYKSKIGRMYLVNHDENYFDVDLLKLEPFREFNSIEWFDDRVYLTE